MEVWWAEQYMLRKAVLSVKVLSYKKAVNNPNCMQKKKKKYSRDVGGKKMKVKSYEVPEFVKWSK